MEHIHRRLIAVQVIQAALVFVYIFLSKSEPGRTVFLWFSKSRLVLLLIGAGIVTFNLWALNNLRNPSSLVQRTWNTIEQKIKNNKLLIPLLVILIGFTVGLSLGTIKILSTPLEYTEYSKWAPDTFPTIYAYTKNLLPFLLLIIISSLELTGYLVYRNAHVLRDLQLWADTITYQKFLIFSISAVSITHWINLYFQFAWFVNIPSWYWVFILRPWSIYDVFYISLSVFLLSLAAWLSLKKKRLLAALFVIFVAGWALQLGIGFLEGEEITSFKNRYLNTYHAGYLKFASSNDYPLLENIQNYDHNFPNLFTRTKPPGLMTIYLSLERLVNGNPSDSGLSNEVRFQRLADTIVVVFPLLGSATALLLYAFSKRFLQFQHNWQHLLPSTLYILSPNIVLLSLFADQALYPALFLSGTWLIFILFRNNSGIRVFFLGVILFIYSFFAFTMLPLFFLAAIYLVLLWWQSPKQYRIFDQIKQGTIFLLGVVIAYFLFRWLLNYDVITRFSEMYTINHGMDFYERVGLEIPNENVSIVLRLNQIFNALWRNNLEFATTVGVGIYILFLVYGIRLTIHAIKRKLESDDIFLASLFFAFILLNLSGATQGEVGRLWMFWVPMIVLFAAKEASKSFKHPALASAGLVTIQLITILLTFHYQDLIM